MRCPLHSSWILLQDDICCQFSTFSSGSLVKSFTRTRSSIYLAQVFKSQDSRTMYWTHWTAVDIELLTLFKLTLCSVVVLFWYFTHLLPFICIRSFCIEDDASSKGGGMLWSIFKVIFKTDLPCLLSLVFVSLSLVFVHVLFSCCDRLFLLVFEVMLSSRIYLLPY